MYHYRKDGSQYLLTGIQGDILWGGDEVAVAFSYNPDEEIPGTLHKHGSPARVTAWADTARRKLSANCPDLANSIIVISGQIPVEELEKIISISGYVGRWYKSLQAKNEPSRLSKEE